MTITIDKKMVSIAQESAVKEAIKDIKRTYKDRELWSAIITKMADIDEATADTLSCYEFVAISGEAFTGSWYSTEPENILFVWEAVAGSRFRGYCNARINTDANLKVISYDIHEYVYERNQVAG